MHGILFRQKNRKTKKSTKAGLVWPIAIMVKRPRTARSDVLSIPIGLAESRGNGYVVSDTLPKKKKKKKSDSCLVTIRIWQCSRINGVVNLTAKVKRAALDSAQSNSAQPNSAQLISAQD